MNKEYTQLVEEIVESLLTEINWDKAQEYFDYWGPENIERKASRLAAKGKMSGETNIDKNKALTQVANVFRNVADISLVRDMEQKSKAGERVSKEVMPQLQKSRAFIDASGPLPRPRPI